MTGSGSTSATVAVAVSGGVDSLCALIMLKGAYRLVALHGLFLPQGPTEPPPALARACAALGVPLHVADLRAVFQREVLTPFAAAYAAGRTPNPCALCNRAVKFGALLDAALALGAEALATGHYARLLPGPEGGQSPPLLAAAADPDKDQSYFLSLVPRRRLRRALFPLCGHTKAQARALVAAAGLPVPLPAESQDICFAPRCPEQAHGPAGADAYRPFLEAHWHKTGTHAPGPGPVLLARPEGGYREIARHQGLWRYTEGQRKGLGIAHSEALFVLAKDVAANALIVGPRALLGISRCRTGPANVALAPALWPPDPLVRLRHRQRPCPAKVSLEGQSLNITLPEPLFPSAPGQVAAVYDAQGRVLAAGMVEEMA